MFNVALADTGTVVNAVFDKILNPFINALFVLAFLYFVYGIVMFIKNANKQDARDKGKKHFMWGMIGFLVMFGCYTIMQIIVNTLDLESPPGGPDYRNIDQPK